MTCIKLKRIRQKKKPNLDANFWIRTFLIEWSTRRKRANHPNVRSTTQRLGNSTNPFFASECLTTSNVIPWAAASWWTSRRGRTRKAGRCWCCWWTVRAGPSPRNWRCRPTWYCTTCPVARRSCNRLSTSGRWCVRAWPIGCSANYRA